MKLFLNVSGPLRMARSRGAAFGAAALVLIGVVAGLLVLTAARPTLHYAASLMPKPPIVVCGNSALLTGPFTAPVSAVTIPAGNEDPTWDNNYNSLSPNTTYWFAPGVHTLGTGKYAAFTPDSGDTFMGAPGAIINGQGDNQEAFVGGATNVTIEYLTIENFPSPVGQMVVNHDGGSNWIVKYNTIEDNGTGVGLATGSVVTDNCLTKNNEYGFSSFGGSSDITLTDNEISFNDPATGGHGCGCAGGGKFWRTKDGTVTGNYVHDNGDVGIWVDTDNAGFNISNNYISQNWAQGIQYEASYNALISGNTLIDNGWGGWAAQRGQPEGAIYISESGADSRVASNYSGQFNVTDNVFTDNWGGVDLWENANRYCGDGSDPYCTLVDPSVYTTTTCPAKLPESTPVDYFDNCRWKTQNVTVSDNKFNFTPANIGSSCTAANLCGFNGIWSNYGKAPYDGPVVENNISNNQNNHFSDNTYNGPWSFMGFNQGDILTQAQWTAGVSDIEPGYNFPTQDSGNTAHRSLVAPSRRPPTR